MFVDVVNCQVQYDVVEICDGVYGGYVVFGKCGRGDIDVVGLVGFFMYGSYVVQFVVEVLCVECGDGVLV